MMPFITFDMKIKKMETSFLGNKVGIGIDAEKRT